MQITPSNLQLIYQNVNAAFRAGWEMVPEIVYSRFTMEVPSSTREEIYPWLKKIPGVRKWVGPRKVNNVSASSYKLANDDFELTEGIDANDIKDDRLGIYTPIFQAMGEQTRKHPDILLASTIELGTSVACWDGQYFFDVDHPQNTDDPSGSTYTNYYATAGTEGAHALNEANLAKLWQKFAGFLGEDGNPLGIMADTLMVPPALAVTAMRILNMSTVASANAAGGGSANIQQSNPLQGLVGLVINPYLSSTTAWYLMATRQVVKPFLLQMREQANKLVRKDLETDDNVFFDRKYLYGVAGRYAAGYSFPQLAIKADV